MAHRRLPVHLRDKITKYYEHRFQGKLFDEEKILSEVSRPLRKVGMKSDSRINCKTKQFYTYSERCSNIYQCKNYYG